MYIYIMLLHQYIMYIIQCLRSEIFHKNIKRCIFITNIDDINQLNAILHILLY